jgi:hypothetical protein
MSDLNYKYFASDRRIEQPYATTPESSCEYGYWTNTGLSVGSVAINVEDRTGRSTLTGICYHVDDDYAYLYINYGENKWERAADMPNWKNLGYDTDGAEIKWDFPDGGDDKLCEYLRSQGVTDFLYWDKTSGDRGRHNATQVYYETSSRPNAYKAICSLGSVSRNDTANCILTTKVKKDSGDKKIKICTGERPHRPSGTGITYDIPNIRPATNVPAEGSFDQPEPPPKVDGTTVGNNTNVGCDDSVEGSCDSCATFDMDSLTKEEKYIAAGVSAAALFLMIGIRFK